MRVAAVQHDPVWEDAATTRAALTPTVAQAAAAGARVVVLPEMFATGFSMGVERTAEPVDGPTVTWLRERAVANDVWLLGSVVERRDDDPRPRNACHVVDPSGRSVAVYDKVHPFTHAGEDQHFAPGTATVTVDVEGVRISPIVCYDLRFADLTWGLADATDCYVVVACWPSTRREHWRTLLRARAIENQAWVVAANRVGTDGNGLDHVGDSAIIDPLGRTIAEASTTPTIVLGEVDPAVVADVRTSLRFLPDRR
jgi:predicted amidohydrolase